MFQSSPPVWEDASPRNALGLAVLHPGFHQLLMKNNTVKYPLSSKGRNELLICIGGGRGGNQALVPKYYPWKTNQNIWIAGLWISPKNNWKKMRNITTVKKKGHLNKEKRSRSTVLLKAFLEALLVLTECHQSSQLWQGSEMWQAAHCSLPWILSSSIRPL